MVKTGISEFQFPFVGIGQDIGQAGFEKSRADSGDAEAEGGQFPAQCFRECYFRGLNIN